MRKIFLTGVFMLFFTVSYAGLSVDPAVINVNLPVLSEYKGKYTIKNTYDFPITVLLKLEDWNTYSGNADKDVHRWLKFDKEKYYISAGESVQPNYTISTAEDMKGSVSGRVYFSVEQEQASMVSISISVPIYVTITDTEKIDFSIDSVDLTNAPNAINYKFVLKNEGNVHIRPSGIIEVFDKKKKKLIKTVSISETVPVYCENSREFVGNFVGKDGLKKGKYTAVFKISAFSREIEKEIKFKVSKMGEVATQ